jgi:hypothetical protein
MPLEEFTRRGLFRCSQEAALFLTHAAIGCYEPKEGNDFRKLTLDEIEAAGESALDKRGVILLQDLAKVSQAEVEAGHDRTKLIMPVADSFFGLARYRIDTEVRVGGPVEAGPPPRKKPAPPRRRADVDPDWEPSGEGEDEEESDAVSSGDDVQSSAPPSGSNSYPEGGSDDDAEASNMFASDDDDDDDDDDDGGEDAGDEESDNVDDANDDDDGEDEEDGEEDDGAEEDAQEEEEDDDFGDVVDNDDGEVLDADDARLPTLPAQAPLCGQLQRGSTVPLTSPYCPLDYLAILRDDEAQEAAHVAEMKRREERVGDEADEDAAAEAADADADDGDVDNSDDDAADEEAEAIARVLAASRAVPLVASGVYRDFFASKDAGQRQSLEDTEQAAREVVAGDERLHRDRLGGSEAADRQRAAAKESVRTKSDELERLKALQQLARQKEQDARQVQQAAQQQQTPVAHSSSAKGDGVAIAPANETAVQRSGAFEEQRVRGPTPARALQHAEASASDVASVSSDSSVVVVAPAASAPTPTPQPAVAPSALPQQEPRKAPPAVITVDDADAVDDVEPQPKVPEAPPRRSVAGSRAHLDAARRAIDAARDRLRLGEKRGRAASGAPALPPAVPAPGLLAAIGTRLLLWLLSGGAREAHRSSLRKLNRHLLFSAGMKFELPPECEPAPGSNDMCVATNLFLMGALPRAREGHDHPRQRGLVQAVAAMLSDRPMQCRAVSGTKLAHARRDVAAAEIAAFSGSAGLRRVPDAIQMQRASVSLQVTTHAIAFGDETMLAGARRLDQPLIVVVVLESDDDVSDALTSLENLLSSHVNGAPIVGGDGSAAALLRGCVAVIDEAACPDGERMLTQAVSIANARASSRVPLGTVPVRRVVNSGCDVVQAVRDTVMSVVTAAYSVCDVPQVSAADASFNMLPAFEA